MAIEKILSNEINYDFIFPRVKLRVHCSCGKDYTIRQKLNSRHGNNTAETHGYKCRECKETSYIQYTGTGAKIVTDEILNKE